MRFHHFGLSIVAVASLISSGCTAVTSDVVETFKYAMERPQDASLTSEQIEEFPYTALYARRGSQPRALIVLGFVDGSGNDAQFQWVSANREVMETQGGRVIRTFRFEPDLQTMTNLTNDPLLCARERVAQYGLEAALDECNLRWTYEIETANQRERRTWRLTGEFKVDGQVTVEMADGSSESALKLVERVTSTTAPGKRPAEFENRFWVGEDGVVIKSRQYAVPNEAVLELDLVKWVGRDAQ